MGSGLVEWGGVVWRGGVVCGGGGVGGGGVQGPFDLWTVDFLNVLTLHWCIHLLNLVLDTPSWL